VLSLYGAEAFREDQAETRQFVLPHLAQMFLSLERRADAAPARSRLRIVSSR